MQHMRTIGLTLLLAGCNPSSFQDYLDSAPIRVSAAPGKFNGGNYGRAMIALNGTLDGVPVGRVVASGGGGTPLVFVRSYTDGKVSEGTFLRCKNATECSGGADIGATLIPFERWGTKTNDVRELCVFAPANSITAVNPNEPRKLGGNGYVACEAPSNKPQSFTLGPAITDLRGEGTTLKFSGFGLPVEHPLGVALVGVHARELTTNVPRRGGLYQLSDLQYSDDQKMNVVPYLGLIPLVDPGTGEPFSAAEDAADFGALVAGVAEGKDLTVAIAQASKQRVIVARYDDRASGEPSERFRVHACIEGVSAQQLAFGDLTGDGEPELVIASADAGVSVYDGRSLPGPATDRCQPWNAAPLVVPCAGAQCAGFGSSLAIGDVDANGTNDLIVGAPDAELDGKAAVGAVWIVPGSTAGLDVASAIVLTVPEQAGARFGAQVAALHTKDRDEPVASAPGVSDVFTFMCTPLESGFGGDGLCLD